VFKNKRRNGGQQFALGSGPNWETLKVINGKKREKPLGCARRTSGNRKRGPQEGGPGKMGRGMRGKGERGRE